jgi:hypothetical protein
MPRSVGRQEGEVSLNISLCIAGLVIPDTYTGTLGSWYHIITAVNKRETYVKTATPKHRTAQFQRTHVPKYNRYVVCVVQS